MKAIKITLLSFLASVFLFSAFVVPAQTPQEEREELEKELEELEEKIAEYNQDISKTEQEKKTLQNQIYLLRTEINKLDLQIQQSNIMIGDLGVQIEDTEDSVKRTSLKIQESREGLVNILRNIQEKDQVSLIEIFLSEPELSDFFGDVVALESLNSRHKDLLQEIKKLKNTLEGQKESLDEEKSELESVVKLKNLQKQESLATREQKDRFLELTEAEYQEYLKKKENAEQKAAEIRARIFELIGVPEAPTFGEALEIAKYVEGVTGVRPAFLLAVLTQESNIGKNVGQCYLKDPETGDGVVAYNGKTVSRVMKPTRDVQPFLEVTKELGRDPYSTPVSCPMSFGYGGAMGPAQFIPSTWAIYKDEVKKITGSPADPWNIKDAFLAAAVYLADSGAASQTYNSEWRAAMYYFAGSINLNYRFYGDSVMAIAADYEDDIAQLQ